MRRIVLILPVEVVCRSHSGKDFGVKFSSIIPMKSWMNFNLNTSKRGKCLNEWSNGRCLEDCMAKMVGDKVNIFEHMRFSTYFSAYLLQEKRGQRSFSLRRLCRQTGVKSPAMFTWMASGTRLPSPDILERLCPILGWSPAEHAFAQLMVNAEKTDSSIERERERDKTDKEISITEWYFAPYYYIYIYI